MSQQVKEATVFDKFASSAAGVVSRAPFFTFCVLLIVVWAPSIVFMPLDTWQLVINTITTIITFLLVALLQNSQARFEAALNYKNDAIATGLRDLMDHIQHMLPCTQEGCDFSTDITKLEQAIGIEEEMGTKGD